jgi:hypothetical protein
VFVSALLLALRPFTHSDGVFPADGSPHELTVAAGERWTLFVPVDTAANADCQVAGRAVSTSVHIAPCWLQ